jgi:hypothetical protein
MANVRSAVSGLTSEYRGNAAHSTFMRAYHPFVTCPSLCNLAAMLGFQTDVLHEYRCGRTLSVIAPDHYYTAMMMRFKLPSADVAGEPSGAFMLQAGGEQSTALGVAASSGAGAMETSEAAALVGIESSLTAATAGAREEVGNWVTQDAAAVEGVEDAAVELTEFSRAEQASKQAARAAVSRDPMKALDRLLERDLPVPFTHGVFVERSGRGQGGGDDHLLMVSGNPGLVLACCTEYWDGEQLRPLEAAERRACSAFYCQQGRSNICQAFGFKPVSPRVAQGVHDLILLPGDQHGLAKLASEAATQVCAA